MKIQKQKEIIKKKKNDNESTVIQKEKEKLELMKKHKLEK